MRGKLGPILSGVGGFLLVAGVMLNVYAYPKLATAPMDQESTSTLFGPDGTVFDISSLSEVQSDLTTTAYTVGDVETSEEASDETGENILVWENATSTKSEDNVVRSRSVERVAFDGYTGEAVECECDSYSETVEGEPSEVEFEGQVFKFPFQTEQKTYEWWDSTLKRAEPAVFVREEKVEDLNTYVFVQTIEPEVWTEMEVPPSVVGEKGDDGIFADRTYANTRTFWVEPETGVVIKRQEEQRATLQWNGEDRTTLTDVVTEFSDETIQKNLDDYAPKSTQLKLIRTTLPLVLGIAGLVLLVLGLLLFRRDRSRANA